MIRIILAIGLTNFFLQTAIASEPCFDTYNALTRKFGLSKVTAQKVEQLLITNPEVLPRIQEAIELMPGISPWKHPFVIDLIEWSNRFPESGLFFLPKRWRLFDVIRQRRSNEILDVFRAMQDHSFSDLLQKPRLTLAEKRAALVYLGTSWNGVVRLKELGRLQRFFKFFEPTRIVGGIQKLWGKVLRRPIIDSEHPLVISAVEELPIVDVISHKVENRWFWERLFGWRSDLKTYAQQLLGEKSFDRVLYERKLAEDAVAEIDARANENENRVQQLNQSYLDNAEKPEIASQYLTALTKSYKKLSKVQEQQRDAELRARQVDQHLKNVEQVVSAIDSKIAELENILKNSSLTNWDRAKLSYEVRRFKKFRIFLRDTKRHWSEKIKALEEGRSPLSRFYANLKQVGKISDRGYDITLKLLKWGFAVLGIYLYFNYDSIAEELLPIMPNDKEIQPIRITDPSLQPIRQEGGETIRKALTNLLNDKVINHPKFIDYIDKLYKKMEKYENDEISDEQLEAFFKEFDRIVTAYNANEIDERQLEQGLDSLFRQ